MALPKIPSNKKLWGMCAWPSRWGLCLLLVLKFVIFPPRVAKAKKSSTKARWTTCGTSLLTWNIWIWRLKPWRTQSTQQFLLHRTHHSNMMTTLMKKLSQSQISMFQEWMVNPKESRLTILGPGSSGATFWSTGRREKLDCCGAWDQPRVPSWTDHLHPTRWVKVGVEKTHTKVRHRMENVWLSQGDHNIEVNVCTVLSLLAK